MRRGTCNLLVLLRVSRATAQGAHPGAVARVRPRHADGARASFTADGRPDKNGRVVQQASGEFAIARPGKFRWSVDKPYQQLLVGDGERVWIYDPDLNQVVKRRNDQALGSTPAALLAGTRRCGTRLRLARAAAARRSGLARRHAEGQGIQRSATSGSASTPRAWPPWRSAITSASARASRFAGFERNPSSTPELFKFTPPKGADVVGD